MPKCKACGAPIIWIKLKSGKSMPCNPAPIHYSASLNPERLNLVLPEGTVLEYGVKDPASSKYGYTSHFATCPAANQFRRHDQ